MITLKEIAREYGRGWKFYIIDSYGETLPFPLTAESIEALDEKDNPEVGDVVVNPVQPIIHVYLM